MNNKLLYQVGVTMLPGIGDVYARALVTHFGSPEAVFRATKKDLETIEGIGRKRMEGILKFNLNKAEEEITFLKKHNIQAIFFQDKNYPKRLAHCFDSPAMLYYKGNTDLNSARFVAIVGTRNQSEYGRNLCENLIGVLENEGVVVVSGLAFGIDTTAHKASLKHQIETIGVLAHGLDRIYPSENKTIARQMIEHGGLLTEFRAGTIPDRKNFPSRNRIVAGMCDCIVVIESGLKGGSLITAELGNGYNKDVFAFPGRVNDPKSEGCNYLIKTNKAALITSGEDLLYMMGWKKDSKIKKKKQRELFIELEDDEQLIYNLLHNGPVHIDDLYLNSNLNGSAVAKSLLMLEMQGIINTLPGKMYELS